MFRSLLRMCASVLNDDDDDGDTAASGRDCSQNANVFLSLSQSFGAHSSDNSGNDALFEAEPEKNEKERRLHTIFSFFFSFLYWAGGPMSGDYAIKPVCGHKDRRLLSDIGTTGKWKWSNKIRNMRVSRIARILSWFGTLAAHHFMFGAVCVRANDALRLNMFAIDTIWIWLFHHHPQVGGAQP